MSKTKLEKHMQELDENTSGGANDAVTFAGKGMELLKSMLGLRKNEDELAKGRKTRDEDEDEDDLEDDEVEDEDEKNTRRTKKNARANGGELEDIDDEDLDDPGQEGEDEILTNKGKRLKGEGAVKKNARTFDERRFVKSMEEHEEILDASPALEQLAKSVRSLGKSVNSNNDQLEEMMQQNVTLAKAVMQLLKSNAALAADIELIKKQPATSPASGYVLFKGENERGQGKGRRLSKSEIEDVVTEAMNEGLVDGRALSRLGSLKFQDELQAYVEALPAEVQERL